MDFTMLENRQEFVDYDGGAFDAFINANPEELIEFFDYNHDRVENLFEKIANIRDDVAEGIKEQASNLLEIINSNTGLDINYETYEAAREVIIKSLLSSPFIGNGLFADPIIGGFVEGVAEGCIGDIKGLIHIASHPIQTYEGVKNLITSPEVLRQFSDSIRQEWNVKVDRMDKASQQGDIGQLYREAGGLFWNVGSLLVGAEGAAKAGITLGKAGIKVGTEGLNALSGLAKFDSLFAKGGQFTTRGKPWIDISKLTNAQKARFGEFFGGEKINEIFPGAQRIGIEPSFGQTGIDAVYKFSKEGADHFAFVEYKACSSRLGKTLDGLQMSDSWLVGKKTGDDRILRAVGKEMADKIDIALKSDRTIKLLVRTDPFGKAGIGVLDESAKLIPNPQEVLKEFGGKIK